VKEIRLNDFTPNQTGKSNDEMPGLGTKMPIEASYICDIPNINQQQAWLGSGFDEIDRVVWSDIRALNLATGNLKNVRFQ